MGYTRVLSLRISATQLYPQSIQIANITLVQQLTQFIININLMSLDFAETLESML